MSDFLIEVRVRGPEYQRDSNYGPRSERDTMAVLDVVVEGDVAWSIFRSALDLAATPKVRGFNIPEEIQT